MATRLLLRQRTHPHGYIYIYIYSHPQTDLLIYIYIYIYNALLNIVLNIGTEVEIYQTDQESSSLLLCSQCFGRYVLRSSSDVSCRTRKSTYKIKPRPLFYLCGSLAQISLTMTGYKCYVFLHAIRIESATSK